MVVSQVLLQSFLNFAGRANVVFADDLDVKRLDVWAGASDSVEFADSALAVAAHLDVDLQVDFGGIEAGLRLVDGAATDGVAVVGALAVVTEVDDGHHGAVRIDVGLDELVSDGVVAVLAALVLKAGLVVDLGGSLSRGEHFGNGKALDVGTGDGWEADALLSALVRAKLAHLLVVLAVQGAVGLESLCVGLEVVLEEGPTSSNGSCRVEGRDWLVGCRLVKQRSRGSGGSDRVLDRVDNDRAGRVDGLGHAGDPQDGIGDTAAIDHDPIDLSHIVGEVVAAVVVLVGAHRNDCVLRSWEDIRYLDWLVGR